MKKAKKAKGAKKTALKKAPKTQVKRAAGSNLGLIPLGDRVLVKPQPAEDKTSFGIIIPESGKEKPDQGTVIAVGPGRRGENGARVPMDVKIGDKVFFKKPWDEPMKINGVEYYIISESEITLIKE